MKYIKTRARWEASNVSFDPETCRAYSYGHWLFADKVNGKVIFNSYSYSVTTNRHQSKIRNLMGKLGIDIDIFLEAPRGLHQWHNAIGHYSDKIETLQTEIINPRSHKIKNEERRQSISFFQEQIRVIESLIGEK